MPHGSRAVVVHGARADVCVSVCVAVCECACRVAWVRGVLLFTHMFTGQVEEPKAKKAEAKKARSAPVRFHRPLTPCVLS